MNHKGQTLVMFVLLMPLILFLFAAVVDFGKIYYEENHLKNLAFSLPMLEQEALEEVLRRNDEAIVLTSYQKNEDAIEVVLTKKVESLFGKIIGIQEYKVQVKEKIRKEK